MTMTTNRKNNTKLDNVRRHFSSAKKHTLLLSAISLIFVGITYVIIIKPLEKTRTTTTTTSTSSFKFSTSNNNRLNNNNNNNNLDISNARLAWLISYPSSRDAFIQKVIHEVSHTTMATNDIHHVNPSQGIRSKIPYVLRKWFKLPSNYLLIETHCRGFETFDNDDDDDDENNGSNDDKKQQQQQQQQQQRPAPDDVYTRDVNSFFVGCATGSTEVRGGGGGGGRKRKVLYDPHSVRKVVHLYRDPLRNIVQRFHWRGHKDRLRTGGTSTYENNVEGFRRWCRDRDDEMKEDMLSIIPPQHEYDLIQKKNGLTLAASVPCYGMFYQLALWHNNAVDMITQHRLESHVAHFDDYDRDANQFVNDMFDFLELPREVTNDQQRLPSYPSDDFDSYFSPDESVAVSSFLKVICAEKVWMELKRYLPFPERRHELALWGVHLSPRHYGAWPKALIWFAAYSPLDAGVTDITRAVEALSGTTTARNYAGRMDVVDRPNVAFGEWGPYRACDLPFPTTPHILTTTYCSNYRDGNATLSSSSSSSSSSPSGTDVVVTFDDFLRDCATATTFDVDGHVLLNHYGTDIVHRMVHIIRNPFDTIMAQFHHESNNKLASTSSSSSSSSFSTNPDGFLDWCDSKNKQYHFSKDNYYNKDKRLSSLARKIPCHQLFYRYVQWHDHAFAVAEKLNVKSLVLYYEDFYFEWKTNVGKLMNFLNLEQKQQQRDKRNGGHYYYKYGTTNHLPFHFETFPDSFTKEEYGFVAAFVKALPTTRSETYDAIRRYFDFSSV